MVSDVTPLGRHLLNLLLARPHGPVYDGTFISGAEMLARWRIVGEHCHRTCPVSAGNTKSASKS